MVLAKLVKPLFACALAAMVPACSFGVEGGATVGAPVPSGTLTVRWLVTGAASASACSAAGGDFVEIIVYASDGNEVASTEAPCNAFGVTFNLAQGSYTADATLIDAAGSSRSVTKPLDDIRVVSGTDLAIDLDFTASSLL